MVFGIQKLQNDLFCITEERNYFQGKYLEQVSEIIALKDELKKARKEILKLRGELMDQSQSQLGNDYVWDDSSTIASNAVYQTPSPSGKKNGRRRSRSNLAEEKKDGEGNEKDESEHSGDSERGCLSHEEDDDSYRAQQDDENEAEDEEEDQSDNDDDDEDSDKNIRQSAEKLLQWASYRSYARSSSGNSPDHGSLSSLGAADSPLISASATAARLQATSETLLGPIPKTIEPRDENVISPVLSQDSNSSEPTNRKHTELPSGSEGVIEDKHEDSNANQPSGNQSEKQE